MTRMREVGLNFATVVVTAVALTLGVIRVQEWRTARAPSASEVRTVSNWERYSLEGQRSGPIDAPVTIVEFADFQCPYCRLAVPALRELQRWYPGRVALVHRHLPIATHPHAKSAAMAAECAAAQGRFDAMHDSLYARVKDLGVVSWTSLARLAGVPDTASFSRCLIEGVPAARLKADADAAARLGIRATPTFLVNGRLVSGYRGFESLNREVEAELRAWRDGAAQTRNFGEAR